MVDLWVKLASNSRVPRLTTVSSTIPFQGVGVLTRFNIAVES